MDTNDSGDGSLAMDKVCRSCMNESGEMQSLFARMEMAGLQTLVSEMLMACASVQVASGDGLPGLICQPCVHQLSTAYSFKQQCESSDIKLRQYLSPADVPKIKEEKEADALNIVVKPDIDMGVMTEMFDDHFDVESDSEEEKPKKITKKSSSNQCKICFTKLSTKSGFKQHMRKHEQDKLPTKHICDICGAGFTKAFHLKKHKWEHRTDPVPDDKTELEVVKPEVDLDSDEDFKDDPDFMPEESIGAKTRSSRKRDPEIFECTECHKILSTFNGLEIHKRRHTGKNLAQCYLCTKSFTKSSHLKRHLLSHGIDNVSLEDVKGESKVKMSLQCEFCDRKFVYRKSFAHHMRTEHAISDDDSLQPDLQFKLEDTKDAIVENNGELPIPEPELDEPGEISDPSIGEDGDQEFECHVCAHKFSRANHLTRHMTLHRNVLTHKCDRCEKAYVTADHLKQHIQEHHIERPYVCTTCNKPFTRGEHLIRHLKTHNKEDPESTVLNCSVCEKVFNSSENLARHTKQHLLKDKRHICEICNKAFNRLDNLRTHQRVHTGIKDPVRLHLCIYCGKEFNNSSNMIVHMRRHTGERPYKCGVCGKGFPRSHDLKCHERTHSGERPYLCTLCGKSFNKSNKLVRHTRVHTGERPYVCNLCGRAFTQSNDLALHMRRHTGSRPYACGICPARFIQSGQLKAHRRSQGHWVEQEIQFRGNRVEPVHIEGLVETPIKHRKRPNASVTFNPVLIRDLNNISQNAEASANFVPPVGVGANGLTITPLRETVPSNRPVTSEAESFQTTTSSSFPQSNIPTTSSSFAPNDNFNFQQFG